MTVLQITSLVVLGAAFVITSLWRINLGVLLLAAAYFITQVAGIPVSTIVEGFPASVFLLLAGVTYFFTIVESSRTMEYLIQGLLKLFRGVVALAPFVFFAVSGLATALGTFPAATAALILPVAMRFARDFRVSHLLMGVMVVHGILAGSFSPIATFGLVTEGVLSDAGVPSNGLQLFLSHLALHGIICVAAFFLFGGLKLVRARRVRTADELSPIRGAAIGTPPTALDAKVLGRPSAYQGCTMAAIVALVVASLIFGLDIGFVAFILGAALTLAFERNTNEFVTKMPWTVMMLIVGVLSYITVLTKVGTLEAITDALAQLGSPTLAVLGLSLLSAILSAFASSVGVIGANLQLAAPLISAGNLSALSVIGPVTISTTIVDASPLSVGGALILANAAPEERRSLLRKLVLWGLSMIIIGPLLSWFIFTLL